MTDTPIADMFGAADQALPSSIQLEYAVLGAIAVENRLMDHLHFLHERHFHSAPHAAIFKAMQTLHEKGDPITPFTIVLDEHTARTVQEAGGLARYLAGAVRESSSLVRIVDVAKKIVEISQKREFIYSCRRAAETACSESDAETAEEHIANLNAELEGIVRSYGIPDFQNDYEVGEAILEDLKDPREPFSTGIPKLDEAMGGGLFPGRAYGFAARKKVGKTILASTISCNLSRCDVKHLFICGEMSPKEIHQRNLARLTQSFPSAFRTEKGKSKDFLKRLAEEIHSSRRQILFHNAPGLTFSELRRVAGAAAFRHGIKGMILDYWQLVGGKGKGQSTSEHLDEVAQWIADFGRKHGIWTVTMAQINQEGNTRGGEGIRLAFDQVYQIHRDDVSQPDTWLEMMDTRYTAWANIGSPTDPGLMMREKGPYFEQI